MTSTMQKSGSYSRPRSAASSTSIVDYRTIIPEEKLTEQEARFINERVEPRIQELGFDVEEQKTIWNRYKTVILNRETFPSLFPVNKEYDRELIPVEGVRKEGYPVDMTLNLVLGIISRKQEVIERSSEWYQKDFLRAIRPHISADRIYKRLKSYFDNPRALTVEQAKDMLRVITDKNYAHQRDLENIAGYLTTRLQSPTGRRAASLQNPSPSSLVTRLNERTIDLSISNGKYGCCAFWGFLEQDEKYQRNLQSRYHTSVLYLADPDIGLLFHHIEKDGKLDMPTGLVILADLIGKKKSSSSTSGKEERYLLIDSVEAYRPGYDSRFPDNPLREMNNDIWRRITYNSLFQVAKDIGATKMVYNKNFWNEGGNTFTGYLLKRLQNEGIHYEDDSVIDVYKEHGNSFIPEEYNDQFGFFLDSMIKKDSAHFQGEHAIKGNENGRGTIHGVLIEV